MANLILSRKAGESIVIGDDGDIVVTIQSVRGGTVDVRIAAPREVSVHRDEIYAKLHPDSVPEAVASGEAAAERARKPRIFLRRRNRQTDTGYPADKAQNDIPDNIGNIAGDDEINGNR